MATYTEESLRKKFKQIHKKFPTNFLECGGRFEILGNHTDHNHGLCLVGTCSLSIGAVVSKRDDNIVYLISKGHDANFFSIDDLEPNAREYGSSSGLIKGICKYLSDRGYKIGGFDAYMESDIKAGVGVSSSAAFELLIGKLMSFLYNDDKIDLLTLCKAGQFAENNYFDKKSGLLDQIGVAYGGINAIDFINITEPKIYKLEINFPDLHYILVNTGGSHGDLSNYYSQIPESMFTVAKHLGKNFLRDIPKQEFLDHFANGEHTGVDRVDQNRAKHFYEENERVLTALQALKENDEKKFLDQINACQKSAQVNLLNTQVDNHYEGSPQEAIDYANAILTDGACKINGGGFAGSIICFVRDHELKTFVEKMSERYGKDNVIELELRYDGPTAK